MQCSICKRKEIFMDKLLDGRICSICESMLPIYYNPITVKQAHELIMYRGPKEFEATAQYGLLSIDENHGLFVIGEKIKNGTTDSKYIYDCRNISKIQIEYYGQSATKKSVVGFVGLTLTLKKPMFTLKVKLKNRVKVPFYYKDDHHIGWDEPKELTGFKQLFVRMLEIAEEQDRKRWETAKKNFEEEVEREQEYENEEKIAETVFMLDEFYTQDDIKKQRNRLMKTFHTDTGEIDKKYAQKINHYYELLTKKVERRENERN